MNRKGLEEKRNDLKSHMATMLDTAKAENRAMNDDEVSKFDEMEKEIKNIDATIEREEKMENMEDKEVKNEERNLSVEELDRIKFENTIRSIVSSRAEENTTYGENGAVVPTTIANKIIDRIVEICPIYELSDRYNMTGNLSLPKYDAESSSLIMEYADEFTDAEGKKVKFGKVDLGEFLGRALAKVSNSLINNSKFDIVSFVINKIAEAAKVFIERELLYGTDSKIEGLRGITNKVTSASATVLTSDELIDVQEEVIDTYQENAVWIMNRKTRKAIRKLKDGQGNYLLEKDFTAKWGYTLLGKPVYTTDAVAEMGAGKTVIFYGDLKGLAVKTSEDMNIQILKEKYAEQHATGILAFVGLDAKVQDTQRLASLTMGE